MKRNEIIVLFLLLLLGFSLRLAGSALFPLWSGPDEGSHFYHIVFIAERGVMPNMPWSAVSNTLYNQTVGQPPVYYSLLAPVYSLVKGLGTGLAVHLLRLFNVFFGTACIALTYLVAKRLRLGKRVCIGSAAFIALLPTHVVVSSAINNDPLSWLFGLATVYFAIAALETGKAKDIGFSGLNFAAAILTKFNSLALIAGFGIAGLAVLLKGKEALGKKVAALLTPLLAAPIFLRNMLLTGDMIFPRTNTLVLGIPWIAYFVIHFFPGIWLQEYGTATIPEFRVWFFAFYSIVSLMAFFGFLAFMLRGGSKSGRKFAILALLVLPTLLNLAGFVYINTFGLWVDARLMFPTISLVAVMFMLGLEHFMKVVKREAWTAGLIWLFLFSLLLLNLVLLFSYNTVLPDVPWPVP
jgi:4-amino-4-deoxy-L-arabinose transferase-like glycosyltransferase